MNPANSLQRTGKVARRVALTLLVIVVLIGVIGAIVVPPIAKRVAVDQLSAKLGRAVQIDDISFNPYTLKATVKGMRILETDNKTVFASFDTLFADANISSLYQLAPVLDAISLTQLRVNAVRDGENHYNFSDILEKILAEPPSPEPARFSLNNIRLDDAHIDLDDRPQHAKHTLSDISLTIPFISNLPAHLDEYVKPAFAAKANGAPIQLEVETKPFLDTLEAHIAVKIDDLDLPKYVGYLPLGVPAKIDSGRLDGHIHLNFQQTKGKPPTVKITGTASLENVSVSAPEAPLGGFAKLDVDIANIDPIARQIELRSIALLGPHAKLHRDRAGRINGITLAVEKPASAPASKVNSDAAPAGVPLRATLAKLELKGGNIEWQDDANRVAVGQLDVVFPAGAKTDGRAALLVTTDQSGAAQLNLDGLELKAASIAWQDDTNRVGIDRLGLALQAGAKADGKAALVVSTDQAGAAQVNLDALALEVGGLRVGSPDAKQDVVRVAQIEVGGVGLDLKNRQVRVGSVSSSDASITARRDAKGNIVAVPQPAVAARPAPAAKAGPGAPHAVDQADWTVQIGKLALAKYGLNFVDESPGTPVQHDIMLTRLDAENLSNARGEKGAFKAQLVVHRRGTVAVASTMTLNPFSVAAQVDARRLRIAPMQPYIAQYARVNVSGGDLSVRGQLGVKEEGRGLHLDFAGSGNVANFSAVDTGTNEDLLKWSTLTVTKVGFESRPGNPMALTIAEIVLDDFYSRLVINPDGTLNVQNLMVGSPAETPPPAARTQPVAATAPAPAANASPQPAAPEAPAANIRIDTFRLASGRVNFSDHFIKPNYSANLADVEGSVTGLSSDPASRAQVDVRGRYAQSAPVVIKGMLNPLRGDLLLDIQASCKDLDLPSFTAYSQKYAGYGITKGKLSLDVSYHIENRKLEAKNNLFLDQLTFGEKVESPDATKLPVLLAVSLLKNHRGEINIDLPISGSLDDPQFSVGRIIIQVIVNLLAKAATAPFALLGAAFGGGEELSYIEFEPGRSALVKSEEEKLQKLTKALRDRPGLKLDIAGRVDEANDLEALKKYTLLRKVKAAKRDELASSETAPANMDDIILDDKEYPRFLKIAYGKEKIAKPRNFIGMAKDIPVPEMEKLMMDSLKLDTQATQALALRRAERVKGYLIEKGEIGADRLFVITGGESKANEKAKASRVDLVLK